MKELFANMIISTIISIAVSVTMMNFHMKMIKKWLVDFFDKQDLWLKEHFADLARKLFR